MKVFLDTNVLASAFGTRGLCADLLRLILAEHELVTGEVVLEELRRALQRKFAVPAATLAELEAFLRSYHVERKPRDLIDLPLRDIADRLVVVSALRANAELLVTGDREILELHDVSGMRILTPRDFWSLTTRSK